MRSLPFKAIDIKSSARRTISFGTPLMAAQLDEINNRIHSYPQVIYLVPKLELLRPSQRLIRISKISG